MKYCPICNRAFPDDYLFCEDHGARLESEPRSADSPPQGAAAAASSRKVIISGVIAVGVVALLAAGFFLYRSGEQRRIEAEQRQAALLAEKQRLDQEKSRLQEELKLSQAAAGKVKGVIPSPPETRSASATTAPPASSAAPQSDAGPDQTVKAPALAVGDTYVMESTNHANPNLSYVAERKIVGVEADRIKVTFRNVKSDLVRMLEYDRQWNLIAFRGPSGEGYEYQPPIKYYDFPLKPGKRWSGVSTERNLKTGDLREHRVSGEVVGWETVTVPAGTFRAVKVMLATEVKDLKTGQVTPGSDTSWFAPAVKRSVKSEMSSRNLQEARDDFQTVQLLSTSVAH